MSDVLNTAGNVTFNLLPTDEVLTFVKAVLEKIASIKAASKNYSDGPIVWYVVPPETDPVMTAKVDQILGGRCLYGLHKLPPELSEETVIQ